MMVDPHNRLVADSLEANWNDKMRAVASARDDYERQRNSGFQGLDEQCVERLGTLATDFQQLWSAPQTSARERKRMFAHIVEDVTLVKQPDHGTTMVHVRFKGGRTETLTTTNPKSSADQVRTPPEIVTAIDELLEHHVYEEIAEILNQRGLVPGGCARSDRPARPFDSKSVRYVVHAYNLRPRFERLRARGMLTKDEMAKYLGIAACTLGRWAEHGMVARHAYNGHAYLYEIPSGVLPTRHCSRWDTLEDRAATKFRNEGENHKRSERSEEVQYDS